MKLCQVCGDQGTQESIDTFEATAGKMVPIGTRAGCAKHPVIAKQFNLDGTITLTVPAGYALTTVGSNHILAKG